MNSRFIFALGILLVAGLALVRAEDEFTFDGPDEAPKAKNDEKRAAKDEEPNVGEEPKTTNDEGSQKMVQEDMKTETSALTAQYEDSDALKNKGLCHLGPGIWIKPGVSNRCGCMRCICQRGGNWNCAYFFPYCPYYYCGNVLYNPLTHLCCCGKVHRKRRNHACCGYFYYYVKAYKCCNYFSVKPRKATCPRFRI